MNAVIYFDKYFKLWYAHIRVGDTWKHHVAWSADRERCIDKLSDCGWASW